MLAHTREEDIALMSRAAGAENPATPEAVPLQTLIPAFMISELRAAFIIGFVIFVPFLVIDLVVSAALMSMGMMMLPPVMISLPFKILLFVLVDGWGLIITSLIQSYARYRMNANAVLDICLQAMIVAAKLSAPVLVTALVVGLRHLAAAVDHADAGSHAVLRAQGRGRGRRPARSAATG